MAWIPNGSLLTAHRRRRWTLGSLFAGVMAAGSVLPSAALAQALNFRQYTGADGLPQAQVMGIRQDRHGYIWFGTYGGLTRFDGGEFRTYTKANGLSSNAVFDIVEQSDGRLALATSGGLYIKMRERFRCHRQTDGLVSDNARNVTLDKHGSVWVGTLRGLSYFHDGSFQNFTTNEGLPAQRIIRVVIDSAERVWAATLAGLVRRQGNRFVRDTARMPGRSRSASAGASRCRCAAAISQSRCAAAIGHQPETAAPTSTHEPSRTTSVTQLPARAFSHQPFGFPPERTALGRRPDVCGLDLPMSMVSTAESIRRKQQAEVPDMWFAKRRGSIRKAEADVDRRHRYEPRAVYELAESLRDRGVDLARRAGPWQAVGRALQRPGRNGVGFLPIVTNGMAQIMVDTMEHATDLAGLLNWCGVDDLDPVADLVPPPTLRYDGPAFA